MNKQRMWLLGYGKMGIKLYVMSEELSIRVALKKGL